MANKTINDLTTQTSPASGDYLILYVVAAGSDKTRKITRANLLNGVAFTGAAATFTDLTASTSVAAPVGAIDDLTVATEITVGGGVAIEAILAFSDEVTVGTISAGASSTVTEAVPGAKVGGHVVLTIENPAVGLMARAWVSAADTVSIKFENLTSGSILGDDYEVHLLVVQTN